MMEDGSTAGAPELERSGGEKQSAAQARFGAMMDEMVADGRLSASKRRDMEAYVTRSVAEHNRGEEAAWYEAMSFVHEEGAALTAQGCPSEDLRLEAEDEFGAHFGPEVAARLRQHALRWGSSAVGGGGKADGDGDGGDDEAAAFTVAGRGFAPWCDDEHLGDTLLSDPTGTTVWNSALVLSKLLERGAEAGGIAVRGQRVLELGAGVGLW